jgi:hypothetical protein
MKSSMDIMTSDTTAERATTTSVVLLSYFPRDITRDGKPLEPDPH